MNLVVHIPHRGTELESNALSLAQRAPTFTMEWVNKERVSIAIFSSLPTGIDRAVELIGAAIFLEGAWASLNSKPISSLTKLWGPDKVQGSPDPLTALAIATQRFNTAECVPPFGHNR